MIWGTGFDMDVSNKLYHPFLKFGTVEMLIMGASVEIV